jgi:TatD DNase family protein
MNLVDSHCHLDAPEFEVDRNEVLARARAAGVSWFVTVGAGRGKESAPDAVALAHTHQDVAACVGIHPYDALCATDQVVATIATLAADTRVVGVGETGLDYRRDICPREAQKEAFRRLVRVARAVKKPIVVHTRAAPDETLAILREEGARDVGGVIHSFAEGPEFARAVMDMNFDLSLTAFHILQGNEEVRAAARRIPLDRLLIETSAPSLAPPPHRGERNEPAYLSLAAPLFAELLAIPLEEICARSSANAMRRFGLADLVASPQSLRP